MFSTSGSMNGNSINNLSENINLANLGGINLNNLAGLNNLAAVNGLSQANGTNFYPIIPHSTAPDSSLHNSMAVAALAGHQSHPGMPDLSHMKPDN